VLPAFAMKAGLSLLLDTVIPEVGLQLCICAKCCGGSGVRGWHWSWGLRGHRDTHPPRQSHSHNLLRAADQPAPHNDRLSLPRAYGSRCARAARMRSYLLCSVHIILCNTIFTSQTLLPITSLSTYSSPASYSPVPLKSNGASHLGRGSS